MEYFIKAAIPIVVICAFIYNTIAHLKGRPDLTISWLVRDISREHPIIPFLCGLLMGHFFWNIGNNK